MKKLITIAILSVFIFGCGGGQPANNSNSNTNTSANGASGNQVTNSVTPNVNVNTNANTAKVVNNSPTRISFGKGQNWASTNVTLPAGGAQKFVVTAKTGQMMDVEVSSKETSVNLIKGKAQTTEDFGYLNAELQANGDYIFEVRNSTKKEIKTSVKITIEGGKDESAKDSKKKGADSEIDESDSTVMDDDDVLPPPTETPKKKGN